MEPVTCDIEGRTYRIHPFGGIEGAKVYGELAKIQAACKGDAAQITAEILLHPNLLEKFARKTFYITPEGKEPQLWQIFDAHFAGEITILGQWLEEAIRVNFQKRKVAMESGASTEPKQQAP
jgi:hypothetical protein